MSSAINFDAVVYKLQTLVDGGIRVTLDLSESDIPQMAMLAECKRAGIVLKVSCTQSENGISERTDSGAKRRNETYPYKT